jgi:hypothetical protein
LADASLFVLRHTEDVDYSTLDSTFLSAFESCSGVNIALLLDHRGSRILLDVPGVRRMAVGFDRWGLAGSHPGLRVAVLTDDPHDTALVMFFGNLVTEASQVGVFATLDGALDFLDSPRDSLDAHREFIGV